MENRDIILLAIDALLFVGLGFVIYKMAQFTKTVKHALEIITERVDDIEYDVNTAVKGTTNNTRNITSTYAELKTVSFRLNKLINEVNGGEPEPNIVAGDDSMDNVERSVL